MEGWHLPSQSAAELCGVATGGALWGVSSLSLRRPFVNINFPFFFFFFFMNVCLCLSASCPQSTQAMESTTANRRERTSVTWSRRLWRCLNDTEERTPSYTSSTWYRPTSPAWSHDQVMICHRGTVGETTVCVFVSVFYSPSHPRTPSLTLSPLSLSGTI